MSKFTAEDFNYFLVAIPVNVTALEAQRTNRVGSVGRSQDAYTRLLHRPEPSKENLWLKWKPEIRLSSRVMVLEDPFLDQPYAWKMDFVHHMWAGENHVEVKGNDPLSLLWTDGDRHVPRDYRIYDKANDGKTKNGHFWDLIDNEIERL